MQRLIRCCAVPFAFVVAQACFHSGAWARQYALTRIPIGDYGAVRPVDLNDAGHVTGRLQWTPVPGAADHGFVWSAGGGLIDLGEGVLPNAIGNQGTVVGRQVSGAGFRWTPSGGVQPLSSLPGAAPFQAASSEAHDVNATGQILGDSTDPAYRAFVYNPGGSIRTLPLPAQADGLPLSDVRVASITEAGDAVGWTYFYQGSSYSYHTTIWPAGGGVLLLEDVPGGPNWTQGGMMNGRGQLVGLGMDEAGQRPLLYSPDGRITDLGNVPGATRSGPAAINEAGEVVGFSGGDTPERSRAFVWTESEGMLDLNDLLDPSGSGWTLTNSWRINNAGQVLVSGTFDGRTQAALLTPVVPEPAAMTLLAAITSTGLLQRRR